MITKRSCVCVFGNIRKILLQDKGFSLLEAAIGLIVIGLLVLPVMRVYHANLLKKSQNVTYGALQDSLGGVNQYFFSGNMAYPCPADLSLKEGDTNFGFEGNCTLASIKLCSDPTWFTSGGICKTDNTSNPVIIGGIPFAGIKMSQESALDYWGNKLIYAVSFSQTDPATYVTNNGIIKVMSVDDPLAIASGSADGVPDLLPNLFDVFIFSTGDTAIGGYTKNGVRLTACTSPAVGFDLENCNFDDTFFAGEDPNNRRASAYSTHNGSSFFDDITVLQESPPLGTWFQHEDNLSYVGRDYVITSATRVGIGTSDPQESLHVVGDIRSDIISGTSNGAHLKSDSICDSAGTCFNPRIIIDALPEMNCNPDANYPTKRGITRIENSSVKCATSLDTTGSPIGGGDSLQVDTTKFGVKDCGSTGMLAAGVDASGDLICVIP